MLMAFGKLVGKLGALDTALSTTATRASDHAASIRASVAEVESAVRRAETQTSESFGRLRDQARHQSQEIGSLVDELTNRTANQFDDLKAALEGATGPFNEELKLLLSKVELGGASVDELLQKFGDAQIEGQTLRELLDGADYSQFENDIQQLIKGLQRGALDLDGILKFLNDRGGDFGKTVAGWIESFEQGKITLGRLKDLISGAEEEFAGTDFGEFLDEIEDAIDSGRLE